MDTVLTDDAHSPYEPFYYKGILYKKSHRSETDIYS